MSHKLSILVAYGPTQHMCHIGYNGCFIANMNVPCNDFHNVAIRSLPC